MTFHGKNILAGGILAALACIGGTAAADTPRTAEMQPNERVVKLFRVAQAGVRTDITYPGRVQPVRHAELFFRVSGPVLTEDLKYGHTFEQGEIMMRIDPRDYEREVERLSHQLEAQKIEADYAETEYRRQKRLLDSTATSRSTYDAALTKRDASAAQVKILETSLKIAKDRLGDTILRAPFHGTVADIRIHQFEIAHAYVAVMTLEDLREMEIKVNVPGGNLPQMNMESALKYLGKKFEVTFPGRGDRRFTAAITEFKPVAAAESETYELILRMKQPDDFLILPGMTAEVHGLPHYHRIPQKSIVVPFAAVIQKEGGCAVWVYLPETGKLQLRKVRTGRPAGSDFITLDGDLKPGEFIVAAGGDWLNEKTVVRLLNPEVLNHETH